MWYFDYKVTKDIGTPSNKSYIPFTGISKYTQPNFSVINFNKKSVINYNNNNDCNKINQSRFHPQVFINYLYLFGK